MHKLSVLLKYRLVPAIVLFLVFIVSSTLLTSYTDASTEVFPSPYLSQVDLNQDKNIFEPEQTLQPIQTPIATLAPTPIITPKITDPPQPQCTFTSASGEPFLYYKYGEPVPESKPVDDNFFTDAVFVGDSRTEGFKLYSGLKTADILAAKCINVKNIYSEDVIFDEDGGYVSIIDALSWQAYSKVYIMLGINELGYEPESFIKLYSILIDSIRELQPEADIYLQAIIPVTKEKDEKDSLFTNERIRSFNEELIRLAVEKDLFYIDTYNGLCNDDGYLPEDASFDGIHLYKDYCVQWLDYLKTHTLLPSDGTVQNLNMVLGDNT